MPSSYLRVARAFLIPAVALLIAWASIPPGAAAASTNLNATLHSRHFFTYYNSGSQLQAELLSDVAEEELARVSRDLDYTPDPNHPFPLKIYTSRSAFVSAEGLEGLKMTVGTTQAVSETIAIDASGLLVLPREVISHEITHAILFRMLGPNITELPLWFNEGLAQYESGAYQGTSDEQIADAAGDNALVSLPDLSGSFPPKQVDLAYAESVSAVRYLVVKYGPTAPRTIAKELARTGSFDKAMLAATKLTSGQFADTWYAHVTERFWPVRVTRVAMGVLWAVMALLAVVAFIRRRRRMAESAREWELEQFEEALRRQQGNDWSM